jgi:pimeloyl-ACP methyl ester carboxylesterase
MRLFIAAACIFSVLINSAFAATETPKLITSEHFVHTKSVSPALRNRDIQLYLREVKLNDTQSTSAVLFIHGSGTPSNVSFDIPYKDYSWMGYLAREGFDVYALDLTGYGRSTRPTEMNDPCNLSASEQKQFIPSLIKKVCAKNHAQALTTIDSDWADMDAAVNFIRAQKHIKSLALIGWSQGGPRNLGYIQRHQGKVNSVVLLAPAYHRDASLTALPVSPVKQLMWAQNQTEFNNGWDQQIGCPHQVDEPIRSVIWREMLASDTLGKTWGTGVRRAPEQGETWGFNQASAAAFTLPALLIAGEFDRQVLPKAVHELYADLGSPQKVVIDLACSSHRASWETNHLLLFKASADWLKHTAVSGTSHGELKLGYSSAHANTPQ